MKFFNNIQTKTLKSNYQQGNWAYPCGAQDTAEPSHLSNCLYSTHHNQQPKNVVPSNVSSTQEIPVANGVNCVPSNVLLSYSHSKTVGNQCANVHDLCSQHLSGFSHSQNYKSELADRDNETAHHQSKHGNDISLSTLNEHINELHYENYVGILPQCKDTKIYRN